MHNIIIILLYFLSMCLHTCLEESTLVNLIKDHLQGVVEIVDQQACFERITCNHYIINMHNQCNNSISSGNLQELIKPVPINFFSALLMHYGMWHIILIKTNPYMQPLLSIRAIHTTVVASV